MHRDRKVCIGVIALNFETLLTFVLLAENNSFTKTAELQHIVQSTVSARIHDLENELGKTLFRRDNRRVELTAAGTLYVDYAKRLISLYEESKSKIGTSKYFDRRLTIGSLDIIWRSALHKVVQKFVRKNPNVSIHSINYSTNFITPLLLDRTIDVAFICLPIRMQTIRCMPAFYDDVILVANPEHQIASKSFVELDELKEIPFVYGDMGGTFNEWFDKNMKGANNLGIRFDVTSLMMPFLTDGYGPGFILRSMADKELREGRLVEIPLLSNDPLPRWESYMAFDKAKGENPEILQLIELIKEINQSAD